MRPQERAPSPSVFAERGIHTATHGPPTPTLQVFAGSYRVSESETNRGSKLRHTSTASTARRPSAVIRYAACAAPPIDACRLDDEQIWGHFITQAASGTAL